MPPDRTVFRDASPIEGKNFLHRDYLTFHARHFMQAYKPAGAILEAVELQNDVDRRCDLLAHGSRRQIESRHRDHLLEPREGIAT